MNLNLECKLAVVTGAARGIGAAIARGFVDEGASVLMIDMNDDVAIVAAELGVESLVCDLTQPGADKSVAAAAGKLGGASILVNNAGISRPAPLPETSDDEWAAIMDVNLGVAFRLSRALWSQLSANDGAIVNLASFASKRSTLFGNNSSYVAAKHGVAGLTRAAAYEGATQGIRVNAIAPGAVLTERVRNLMEQDNDSGPTQEIIEKHLLGLGHPQQVASVALFFASDDSNWVTGQILPVDGGASVH